MFVLGKCFQDSSLLCAFKRYEENEMLFVNASPTGVYKAAPIRHLTDVCSKMLLQCDY